MARKKRQRVELRYYEIPRNDNVLALLGDGWKRNYGNDIQFMHFHNLWEVGYCYYGSGNIELADGTALSYSEGTFTFIPINLVHNTRTKTLDGMDYWEFLFFDIDKLVNMMYPNNPVAAQTLLQKLSKRILVLHENDYKTLATIIKLIIAEMRENKENRGEITKYYANILILEISRITNLVEKSKAEFSKQKLYQIKPALDYVDDKYSEALKVQTLAACCGMSETHFRRLFEDTINMTPLAYINLVRVHHACELLYSTDRSVESIAEEVGFISQVTFNRNFTKLMGMPPYKWKRTAENYQANHLSYHISAREGWFW